MINAYLSTFHTLVMTKSPLPFWSKTCYNTFNQYFNFEKRCFPLGKAPFFILISPGFLLSTEIFSLSFYVQLEYAIIQISFDFNAHVILRVQTSGN
jgi:hypothetical protein